MANEITNFNVRKDDLRDENPITKEHVKNNQEIRKALKKRRIRPEELPAEEDIKNLKKRVEQNHKKRIAKLIKAGAKKLLSKIDSDNFFEVEA